MNGIARMNVSNLAQPLAAKGDGVLGGFLRIFLSRRPAVSESPAVSFADPPARKGFSRVPTGQVASFITLQADGRVIACNGHVDLGTGLRTALAQIVAEELDVPFDRVTMVMGDTDRTPDQGPTTASASIQSAAVPMRRAAAQARQFLLGRAAARLGSAVERLTVADGVVRCADTGASLSYGELLGGERLELDIAADTPLKDRADYKIVGRSVPRVDIPDKALGRLVFVHDLRLPGMVHARVVRPPHAGREPRAPHGSSLLAVDRSSIAHLPGIIDVVVIRDFVAVVAEREECAIQAARRLKLRWKPRPELPDMDDLPATLRANPDRVRPLKEQGDVDAALQGEPGRLQATYVWPYQMHGSIGPSCGVAESSDGIVTVWTGSQNPHMLHADLVDLLRLPAERIRVVRMEAAGCYGRNCADDAAAEAALLALEVGRPVRVQLMREEEHAWEPKGAAQLLEVSGAVTARGTLAYDFASRYPSNNAPLLSLLHTDRLGAEPVVEHKGDRTAVPQYRIDDLRIVARDMPPIVRAAWLRGVSAMPNVFAHESFIDELAALHASDPVEFRLRFMQEPRAVALVDALAQRAGWTKGPAARGARTLPTAGVVRGRGFAQHQYVHGTFPGVGAAWCAWVCDVEVDVGTGKVRVVKVWVGYDCGLMINPAGVHHQIHGNVIQSVSRVLKEQVRFDRQGVVSREWGSYPILSFLEVPAIDVLVMPAADHPPLGVGESASVPSAAAIANAIFDATGVRLREVPFTPDRIKAGLAARAAAGTTFHSRQPG
jgi:CO/xanthine dehydrogenase Mo-binding subunit